MEEAAVLENTAVFIYNKGVSYIFKRRKIWNPQSEFTSDEEQSGISRHLPMEFLIDTSAYSSKVPMK